MKLLLTAIALLLTAVPSVRATFHLIQIEQLIGGVSGDPSAQAIQLRMRAGGQNLVSGGRLVARDAAGANAVVVIDFTSNVAQGATGDRVLVASPNFALYVDGSLASDFAVANLIPPSYLAAGRFTLERDTGEILWSLSWGGSNYTGATTGTLDNDANGDFGPSVDATLPADSRQALQFQGNATAPSTSNLADYALTAGPSVWVNNAGDSFSLLAGVLVVTTTNDSGPGSLRQALLDANASNDVNTIKFNIAGSGVQTINLTNALPACTEAVTLDGFTQPGADSNTPTRLVQLTGMAGLVCATPDCVVRGLVLHSVELQSSNATVTGNEISGNTGAGVIVTGANIGNAILGNAIFNNGGLGIDLNADGVTTNDTADADTGANALQNFPVLTQVRNHPNQGFLIKGTLDSAPNTTYRVEFFANADCDPSAHGEGETFLGAVDVPTDGTGHGVIDTALPIEVPTTQTLTATATDPAGNTSEFSACAPIGGPSPPTHDLAVIKLKAPKKITLSATFTNKVGKVSVTIQNRGNHSETITNLTQLAQVVTLAINGTVCTAPAPTLVPLKEFPVTILSKKKLKVTFLVNYSCPDLYTTVATAHHTAIDGEVDTHAADDSCPHAPLPGLIDPNPDNTLKDKGCGGKNPDGTLGADVLTDVIVK